MWSEGGETFISPATVSIMGRGIAKVFLPFHGTGILILLGFPQKSLVVKALTNRKMSVFVFHCREELGD